MSSAFLIDQISVSQTNAGKARYSVAKIPNISDDLFRGNANVPFAFVAFGQKFLTDILCESSFHADRITFGKWMGFRAAMGQCEIVARPMVALSKDFDPERCLELNPGVAKPGVDPARHCLTYGRLEGRPLR